MTKVYEKIDEMPWGRTADNCVPGCLVLEGGGWRGLYTIGVLDRLMQDNVNLRTTVGVSAGALSGMCYLTGQIGLGVRIDLKYRHDPQYVGPGAFKRDHGITGFTYLYEHIINELGMDKRRLMETPRRLVVVATNMETGQAEYFEKGKCNLSAAIRASATVPFMSRPGRIGGVPYLDGGCAEKIPYEWAKNCGEEKIVVVKTREWDYRRKEGESRLVKTIYKDFPNFVEAMNGSSARFNRVTEELAADDAAGKIVVIAPTKPVTVKRFEGDLNKLADLYWCGYHDAEAKLPALKAYLGMEENGSPQGAQ